MPFFCVRSPGQKSNQCKKMKISCQSSISCLQSYYSYFWTYVMAFVIILQIKKIKRQSAREGSLHDGHFIFKSTMYKTAQHIQHKNNYLKRQNTTALHFPIIVQNVEMLHFKRNKLIFQMAMAGFREIFIDMCCIHNLRWPRSTKHNG